MNSLMQERESGRAVTRPMAEDERHALVRSLYAEHDAALHGYVTRLLGDPHQAETVRKEIASLDA